MSGKIYPLHAVGTKITIERYLLVRGKYVRRGSATAKVGRNRSTYSVRMTLSRGTWRLRAVAPYDKAHTATASPKMLTVLVR